MNIAEYLTELESAHRSFLAAKKVEDALTRPVISDISKIRAVFILFSEELPAISQKKPDDPENRRIFIFICLRLFCPKAFTGNVITYGVCEEMARVLKCHRTLISHNVRNLIFTYRRYKDFREKVDMMYEKVSEKLEGI